DMVTGQFIADLISWGAIGARTTESQIHREMASALSCPVGFKNGTDGNTRIAVDAIRAARASHMFLSPDKNGQMTIYQTSGNPYGHIIMRGGKKPNYHADDIAAACDTLHEFDLPEHLVVDFSHGNCQKQHRRQLEVCEDICQQGLAIVMSSHDLNHTLRHAHRAWLLKGGKMLASGRREEVLTPPNLAQAYGMNFRRLDIEISIL
ncbi:3-deoxy-7-phosphoheptulonate synthase, partial [Escherichia sp. TWPC-MK]